MREDFAKISREIRTAQPHVPEVYLTVTRGFHAKERKRSRRRVCKLRAAKPNVSAAQ